MPTLGANTTTLNRFLAGASKGKAREKKKRVSQERLQKLWWATAVAASLGVHKRFTAHTRWLAWGQKDAWPWYTGAEALRAETPSSRQWCPLSVSFLKADYRSRDPGKMAISSLSVWTQPFSCQPKPHNTKRRCSEDRCWRHAEKQRSLGNFASL